MEKIHIIQDFSVPKEKVFNFFSEHERLSKIYPGAFKRIIDSKDPNNINGLGSVRRITNFPIIIDEEITQFEPNSLIEYKLIQGGGPIKDHLGIMRFYDLDNGVNSRLDYTIEFRSSLPGLGFIFKNVMQNVIGNAIRTLRNELAIDGRF